MPPSDQTSRRRAIRSAIALLLALTGLSSSIAPLLHAGHAHRYCETHQGFEEGAERSETPDRAGLSTTAAEVTSGEHIRCDVTVPPAIAARGAGPLAGFAAAYAARAAPALDAALPQIAVLARAPKASPPRA